MAAGPCAALGEPSCGHFFTILHCKMKKKWAAPAASVLAAKITAHFFSILQCKMKKEWLQDPLRPWANRPAASFHHFTVQNGGKMAVGRPEQNEPKMGPK